MQVEVDDARYAIVVKAFATRMVSGIATALHNRSLVDLRKIRPEDLDLIYDLCFVVGAVIENHGGFEADGESWVAHCLFADRPKDPSNLLASWQRTGIHGFEDDVLHTGVEEAMRRLS